MPVKYKVIMIDMKMKKNTYCLPFPCESTPLRNGGTPLLAGDSATALYCLAPGQNYRSDRSMQTGTCCNSSLFIDITCSGEASKVLSWKMNVSDVRGVGVR